LHIFHQLPTDNITSILESGPSQTSISIIKDNFPNLNHYSGIDSNSDSIKNAKQSANKRGVNFDFHESSVEDFHAGEQYDLALDVYSATHYGYPEKFNQVLVSHLKEGGIFASMPGGMSFPTKPEYHPARVWLTYDSSTGEIIADGFDDHNDTFRYINGLMRLKQDEPIKTARDLKDYIRQAQDMLGKDSIDMHDLFSLGIALFHKKSGLSEVNVIPSGEGDIIIGRK
jgi:SAM-dependent methyltransferase